jgi:phenylacetic acid degradation protein
MPARVIRTLSDEEVAGKTRDTEDYISLAQRSRDSMREVEAMDQPEPGRRRIGAPA